MRIFLNTLLLICVALMPAHVLAQAGTLTEAELTQLVEGDLKAASKTLKQQIEANPKDAELFKVAGDIYAVRAQNASLFSAPGLAKRCVKSYEAAVELAPNDDRYRMALMQFYAFAPGIVGGSKKKAAAQLNAIESNNPVSGIVAKSFLLLAEEDQEGLEQLFTELSEKQNSHPRVRMAKANWLRSQEKYDQSMALIQELIALPTDGFATKQESLLPYKAMLQAGFIGNMSEAHLAASIKAFERYLAEAPITYHLTSKKWVRLFLGKAHARNGDNDKAMDTLTEAKRLTSDESLLDEIEKALQELES